MMLCPLDISRGQGSPSADKPRLDLHWRKDPPVKWGGSIERAYYRIYPDVIKQVLCLQCGAVPCPLNHEEAPNKQHLADTQFIRELTNDRGEVKKMLKKMKDEVEAANKQKDLLRLDKEMLMSKAKVFEKLKSEWMYAETLKTGEIRKLTSLNEQKKQIIEKFQKEHHKTRELKQRLNAIEEENHILRGENEIYRKRMLQKDYANVTTLLDKNDRLTQELGISEAKIRALFEQIQESKNNLDKEKQEVISLKTKMAASEAIIRELGDVLKSKDEKLQEKEKLFQSEKISLHSDITLLKLAMNKLKSKIKLQLETIKNLEVEIRRLKHHLANDSRFIQYVEVKREYNSLKEKGACMAQKLQEYEHRHPRPTLEEEGSVTARSAVCGPGAWNNAQLMENAGWEAI